MAIVLLYSRTNFYMSRDKKINCIGDCRISSHKQQEGSSLEDQENQILRFAKNNNWEIISVFKKVYSGRASVREDFEEIIDYIKKQRKEGIHIHKYIIYSIDRFTRDGAVVFQEMKRRVNDLGTDLVDVGGIIQPMRNTLEYLGFQYPWSEQSPTATAELAKAQNSKDEVTNILTRMIGAEIRLVQEGFKVRQPNDGFKNDKVIINGKKKVIQIPDPERVQFFKAMYDFRIQGLDDNDIVARLNAMNFRTKIRNIWDEKRERVIGQTTPKLLTIKHFQRLIQRPIYAGVLCEKWTHNKPIYAQYKGIVTIDEFNKANRGKIFIKENHDGTLEILYNYICKAKRLKNNPDYPFKFILCPFCEKPMLGSKSRGKSGESFKAYHCGKTKSRKHDYFRVPKDTFDSNVTKYLRSLKSESSFMDAFELILVDVYREHEKKIVSQSSLMNQNVGQLKAEQASVLNTLLATQSIVARKKIEERIDELEVQIKNAENQRNEIEITEKNVKSYIRYVKYVMEHLSEVLLDTGDLNVQTILFSLVFEQTPTYIEILNGTPKLSLSFKLSEDFKTNKTQLVTPQGIEPWLID